jgi:HEAT repeat protein/Flp pilus assembly protein protease CpaA
MKGKDPALRATAAYAVWRIGGQVEAPLETLTAILEGKDEVGGRWEAASGLQEMGPAAKAAVPALCSALEYGSERLRRKAVEALAAIRSQADVAVPALAKVLRDPDWYVRSGAAAALGAYGAEGRAAVPELTQALKDKEGLVQVAAAFALYRIEGRTEPAVPVLLEILEDGNERSYAPHSAAETLGKIGPPARAAIPPLTAALRKDDRRLRIRAAGALWKITGEPDPALSVLIEALQDGTSLDETDTNRALDVLEDMGPQAEPAVPALLAAHRRAGGWTREKVERVLRKMNHSPPPESAMSLLDPTLWALGCACLLMLIAAVIDIRSLSVPNRLSLTATMAGWLLAALIDAWAVIPSQGGGFLSSLAAAVVGFLLLVPFYASGILGAGCVKMQMAFGAWVGCALGLSVAAGLTALATVAGGLLTAVGVAVAARWWSTPQEPASQVRVFPAQVTLSLGAVAGVVVAGLSGWI